MKQNLQNTLLEGRNITLISKDYSKKYPEYKYLVLEIYEIMQKMDEQDLKNRLKSDLSILVNDIDIFIKSKLVDVLSYFEQQDFNPLIDRFKENNKYAREFIILVLDEWYYVAGENNSIAGLNNLNYILRILKDNIDHTGSITEYNIRQLEEVINSKIND